LTIVLSETVIAIILSIWSKFNLSRQQKKLRQATSVLNSLRDQDNRDVTATNVLFEAESARGAAKSLIEPDVNEQNLLSL